MDTTARLPLEHVIALLIPVWSLMEARWFYPMLLRRVSRGEPNARMRIYWWLIGPAWTATLLLAAIWIIKDRPIAWLRLSGGSATQTVIGATVSALILTLVLVQRKQILHRPALQAAVRRTTRRFEGIMPRTPSEYRLWVFVSFSAGLCEEVLFRGWLIWYAMAWIPLLPAVLVSSVLFGLGHSYLGRRQTVVTGVAGLAFAALAIGSGSLVPGMVLHFALDWNSGDLAHRCLAEASPPEPAAGSSP